MRKDYNNPLDQMKAISWQLKRIADVLERQFPDEEYHCQPTVWNPDEENNVDSTKLKSFLDRLKG